FTFELAVQKEQKLVTDGVYGIVRNPSSSATILTCIIASAGRTLTRDAGCTSTSVWCLQRR
ncbi:hypothetical protein EV714DRAFT_218595, partial [Schizophyllum commune]